MTRFPPVDLLLGLCCALLMLCVAAPSRAQDGSGFDLLSADTLTATLDLRLVGVDGEQSWVTGGFGKLRYGGSSAGTPSQFHLQPTFAEANLIWQPSFSWSLKALVVGTVQGVGDEAQVGLSEAFLSWKPLSDSAVRLSARAGLMWPPISLEHSGAEWAVTETITPSAINSWIGEEVKVLGAEATVQLDMGAHKLSIMGALFDNDDTAGTLLAFRGWALHDGKTVLQHRQLLPPLNSFISYVQPRMTHPLNDVDSRLLANPGFYARLVWQLPLPIRLDATHYDNRSDPHAVDREMEWGWRTSFDNIGLVADLMPDLQLRAQGMSGRTEMGYSSGGIIWVDTRFRSAFALITRHFAQGSASARIEAFGTRNHGSKLTGEDDEDGWAATLAARRSLGQNVALLVEGLHVESDRAARMRSGLTPGQDSNQVQLSLRARW